MIEQPTFSVHILTGGRLPERKTQGSVSYDVSARAVISLDMDMDTEKPYLRQTLFEFKSVPYEPQIAQCDPQITEYVEWREATNDHPHARWVYRLDRNESVLIGVGFLMAMDFPWHCLVLPRGGLTARDGVTVAPGSIEPDYRGEIAVYLFNNSKKPFFIGHGDRLAEIIFQKAALPSFEILERREDLSPTFRGSRGFGSTGI